MTRWLLSVLMALGGVVAVSPPDLHAGCVVETTGTYAEGTNLRDDKCDRGGNKKVTSGTTPSGTGAATAAAPTLAEAATGYFSWDLSGNLRMTLGTLLAGEDLVNNLLMVSGGATRVTQLVGTGGVPSTASDATGSAVALPVGLKTFQAVITCTGTCVQTQKIYGTYSSSADTTKSDLVYTITLNNSTTDHAYFKTDLNYTFWFVVTSLTSGTTPLALLDVYY